MKRIFKIFDLSRGTDKPAFGGLEILKYIGPGLLVTVGFIDPGNWASNVATGALHGYNLLWIVTLSTIMLIILQHNAAHLGIATGLCISEASTQYVNPWISRFVLGTAVLASVSTALAEILGGAIGLKMLFGIPIKIGATMTAGFVAWMLYANTYRKLEKWIIGLVSLIGLSFIFELFLLKVDWRAAAIGWVNPQIPTGSIALIMSVLGAVVMPHNLFLHSEIIQSRQWNLENETVLNERLRFEFVDTLFSMLVGWGINSAMIIVAACTFFVHQMPVNELEQAQSMLKPMLGPAAAIVFAVALLMSGLASSITAGMAGGSIFAGIFREPYDLHDKHSKWGVGITILGALAIIYMIHDTFKGLIISQMVLSIQLPFTIFLQIYLTSSKKVMGKFANSLRLNITLWIVGIIVTLLNLLLLKSLFE